MGLVVLIVAGAREQPALGPRAGAGLAALGVTSVAFARGGEAVAAVVDGWSFDPARAGEVAALLGIPTAAVLTSFVQMAVSAAATEGSWDEKDDAAALAAGAG